MPESKVYPDTALIRELQKRKIATMCMWQLKGPKNTGIAWIECWMISKIGIVHITTFKSGGWDVLTNGITGKVGQHDRTNAVADEIQKLLA